MRNKILILLFTATNLYGADQTVTDCTDFATIQTKIGAAGDGDTVFFPQCDDSPGHPRMHWTDKVIINNGVRLTGQNPNVVNPGQDAANPTVNRDPAFNSTPGPAGPTATTDVTIIEDDAPNSTSSLIAFQGLTSAKRARVDHLTFVGDPAPSQTFSDGKTTSGSPALNSANANFVATDVGKDITSSTIVGGNLVIPKGTSILSKTDAHNIVMTKAATATTTGLAFDYKRAFAGDGRINFIGDSSGAKARLDNCHILYPSGWPRALHIAGWVLLVVDHNLFELPNIAIVHVTTGTYPIGTLNPDLGHASWADYPRFGQDNNGIYIEDNTVLRREYKGGPQVAPGYPHGLIDGDEGMRYVFRHNFLEDAEGAGHGTEGINRGSRTHEVYNNTQFLLGASGEIVGFRSGTLLVHDNWNIGKPPSPFRAASISNFREGGYRRDSPFGGDADGASAWDKNVTDITGGDVNKYDKTKHTFVAGHLPYVFASGTCTSTIAPLTVMTDIAASFPVPNGLVGYSISNYNPHTTPPISKDMEGNIRQGTYIVANTATTITFAETNTDQGVASHMTFQPGDHYKIHRILQALDQMGGGRTVVVSGTTNPVLVSANGPIAAGTGGYSYPVNSAGIPTGPSIEPAISWRNTYHPSTGSDSDIGIGRNQYPTNYIGDVSSGLNDPTCTNQVGVVGPCTGINLGANPSPAPTSAVPVGSPSPVPQFVKTKYGAALNGVPYTGDSTYPHPCVSFWPTCSASNSAPTGVTPQVVQVFIGQNASIDVNSAGPGVPLPSLSPTPSPSPTPSWASFSGGADGSGTIHISGTPSGTPTTYNFGFKLENSSTAVGGDYYGFSIQTVAPAPPPAPALINVSP